MITAYRRIAVSGSIATDHLMRFPGRFAAQLIPDSLDKVSLSFLVDDLVVRHGGVGANIAYGLARLGRRPLLLGAVGADFPPYRATLEAAGVDCAEVHVSRTAHTARFICTTDDDLCQIASFYAGAMGEPDHIDLAAASTRSGGIDLVVVAAESPGVMLGRARACRQLGLPFAADPSQQLARMSGPEILDLIDGAAFLLTNEYEADLLRHRTGHSEDALRERVGMRVVTLGEAGVRLTGRTVPGGELTVPAARVTAVREPTGAGDAFRAGFFAALGTVPDLRRAAQIGCLMAAHALEAEGSQEYDLNPAVFRERLTDSYGPDATAGLDALLPVAAR